MIYLLAYIIDYFIIDIIAISRNDYSFKQPEIIKVYSKEFQAKVQDSMKHLRLINDK